MAKTAVALASSPRLTFSVSPSAFPALPTPALPVLRSGLPRGGIVEVTGRRSSGRLAAMQHVLAQATARGEVCAVVDTGNQFHPAAAAAAGVVLSRLILIRCQSNANHALRAADLLIHAGGFGVVILDLCEVKPIILNKIPISYWYRFRRAMEHTPTTLLVTSTVPQAKAALQQVDLQLEHACWDQATSLPFLQGAEVTARIRRPVQEQAQRLFLEATA